MSTKTGIKPIQHTCHNRQNIWTKGVSRLHKYLFFEAGYERRSPFAGLLSGHRESSRLPDADGYRWLPGPMANGHRLPATVSAASWSSSQRFLHRFEPRQRTTHTQLTQHNRSLQILTQTGD